MKKLFKICLIFIAVTVISACTFFDNLQNQSAEKISELIIKYCDSANESFRAGLREKINQRLDGRATIKITCGAETVATIKQYCEQTSERFRADFIDEMNKNTNSSLTFKMQCATKETAIDKIPIAKTLSMNRPERPDLLAQTTKNVAVMQNQNFDRMPG